MFLSFYIAYRLTRTDKISNIPIMVALTTLMSFVSIFSYVFPFLVFPLYVFSFPFFFLPGSIWGNPWKITLFQREIFSFSASGFNSLLPVFSFFLLINFSGAILGYWVCKEIPEEFLEDEILHYFSRNLFLSLIIASIFSIIALPWLLIPIFIWYVAYSGLILIPAAVAAILQKIIFVRRQKALTAHNTL